MELKEALIAVVKECTDEYAKSYARAALELGGSDEAGLSQHKVNGFGVLTITHKPIGKMMVGEELKVQLLYVISNLSYWRGERAREVKAVLKQYSK